MTVSAAHQKGQRILNRGAGSRPLGSRFIVLLCLCLLLALAADPGQAQNVRPAPLRDVGIDQKLNEQLPLNLTFRDETASPYNFANILARSR